MVLGVVSTLVGDLKYKILFVGLQLGYLKI